MTAVKYYGELEFWFSLIKVSTIIFMIFVGFYIIFFGTFTAAPTGFSNIWSHGGFFPHGLAGMLMALCIVTASFQGVELIGITAGEADNPKKNLRKAIKNIIWRILIFYVGAVFVVITLYPWNELTLLGAPSLSPLPK